MKRKLSWTIAAIAYIAPPVWYYFTSEAYLEAVKKTYGSEAVCGLPILAYLTIASISAAILSIIATGFGIASYVAAPTPRSKQRLLELVFLILPFLIGGTYAVGILFG